MAKDPIEYRKAPEVAEIARQLITRVLQHHELVNAHIEYVFVNKAPTSRGRATWGKAHKLTGLKAWLSNDEQTHSTWSEPLCYFVIEIAHDVWATLDDNQRVALVDHELSHCAVGYDEEGNMGLSLRHHDVEEFVGVISRNGLWRADVQQLGVVASEQLALTFERVPGVPPAADTAKTPRKRKGGRALVAAGTGVES